MNTSSIERLRALPAVFRGKQAILMFSWEPQRAAQYFYRWKLAGLVKPLGGKSDVYFNLIKDADVERKMVEAAILMAMPSAVVRGHQVLSESGVSTQLCRTRELGVASDDSVFSIDDTRVVTLPPSWLATVAAASGLCAAVIGRDLPRMTPGAAIADLLVQEPAEAPYPDDLDFDLLSPNDKRRFATLAGLDVKLPAEIAYRRAFDAMRSSSPNKAPGPPRPRRPRRE